MHPEFLSFLAANGVDPQEYIYEKPIPRYIRLNPRKDVQPTVVALAAALKAPVSAVSWFPSFYRLDPDVRVGNSAPYKAAEIYGTDVASGVAVHALGVCPDDHVLDLCAAPGMKLCLIADLQAGGSGTCTGVDVSLDRMRVARNVVRKYGVQNARLYVADGTTFDVRPPGQRGQSQAVEHESRDHRVDEDCTKLFHASRIIRHLPSSPSSLYDKVLVDAECTHDGSIAHLLKYDRLGWATFSAKFLDPNRLANLHALQLALLSNGFRLCKPGGTVVYATCSFTTAQNEDIVRDFIATIPDGSVRLEKIEPVDERDPFPVTKSLKALYPNVPGIEFCLRFSPVASQTSGLFIAKFKKLL
ncbi:S-adenosyl-L-methionine-dependent methyltransferase [Geranomyces variabilis]|nr:S-adenosyl-L-methionine-dependent methyltransferase [Geranomyces variabilis]